MKTVSKKSIGNVCHFIISDKTASIGTFFYANN